MYDEDVFGARHLVLGPGLVRDVEDLSVPVPHHPGPGLPRHHAADLRLEAPAALQDVLLQGQDLGGEEYLQSVVLSLHSPGSLTLTLTFTCMEAVFRSPSGPSAVQ